MSRAITLSEAAVALLARRLSGLRVEVTPENRELYRELVGLGLAEPISGFAGGEESHFRLTEEACDRRGEWLKLAPGERP